MTTVNHFIVSTDPFIVEYISSQGHRKRVSYDQPISPEQIKEEYPLIDFNYAEDLIGMHVCLYGDERLLISGNKIIAHLPNKKIEP